MSKRRINPDTGEPELTYREQTFINEYFNNGGNGKDAAIAAGYGTARADQSAYQVLHRFQVQQHIRDRISEATVSADEIIGTLASFMRGNITELLDDNGDFDIELVKKKRLGHLLKTIARTTRKIRLQPGQPPEMATDYRIQLHSPVQAASILARLAGLNRKSIHLEPSAGGEHFQAGLPPNDDSPTRDSDVDPLSDDASSSDQIDPRDDFATEYFAASHHDRQNPKSGSHFDVVQGDQASQYSDGPSNLDDPQASISNGISDPSVWMELLIKDLIERSGQSRAAVVERILTLRSSSAPFIKPGDESQQAAQSAALEPQPRKHSDSSPNLGPAGPTTSGGQVSAPQPGRVQQLKRIDPAVENSRKINATQCLNHDNNEPLSLSQSCRPGP